MLNDSWVLETVVRQRLDGLRQDAERERQARRVAAEPAGEAEPVVWREAFPGVEFRPLAAGPEMMITLMRFRRGALASLHHHRSTQAGYVLEGRLRVTLPDEQLTVSAGECYLLPPDAPHQVRALDRALVLDFFAPGHAESQTSAGRESSASASGGDAGAVVPASGLRPAAPAARRRTGPAGHLGWLRRGGRGEAAESPDLPGQKEEPRDAA